MFENRRMNRCLYLKGNSISKYKYILSITVGSRLNINRISLIVPTVCLVGVIIFTSLNVLYLF